MGVLKVQDPPGSGVWKPITAGMDATALASVRATDYFINVPLSGLGTALDGVTPVDGDRVLLKNQTTASENDIWIARTGAWVRDPTAKVRGSTVRVIEGTQHRYKTMTQCSPSTATQDWRVVTEVDHGGTWPSPQAEGHLWYDWWGRTLKVWNSGILNWHDIGNTEIVTSTTRPIGLYEGKSIYETDTGLAWVVAGGVWKPLGGGGGSSAPIEGAVFRGRTIAAVAANTNIAYTMQEDTHTGWNYGPANCYVVRVAGIYQVTVAFKSNASASLPYKLMKNGNPVLFGPNTTPSAFTGGVVTGLVRCAVGDYLSAVCLTAYTPQDDSPADSNYLHIAQVVSSGGGDTQPIGSVEAWAGLSTAIPAGWLLCDGRAVSRNTYAQLFTAIGTAHGVGDGSTTFNLPNLAGRIPVGLNAADTEFNTVGKTGGEKAHALTPAEQANMPIRSADGYQLMNATGGGTAGYYTPNTNNTGNAQGAYALGGGAAGAAHNNLQPYSTLPYIIKAIGAVSTSSDTGWTVLPYAANYQAYDVNWSTPGYRRIGDIVYLRGMITRNTSVAPAGSTCGTLPVGFRPTKTNLFEQHITGARARVDVGSGGQIQHADQSLGVSGYLSLDGMNFSTLP